MKTFWNRFGSQQHTEEKRERDDQKSANYVAHEDTGFDLETECSQLNQDCLSKLNSMAKMGYNNKKLTFLKLSIYNWNLNDAIQFYDKDKFCWDYSIHGECKELKDTTKCQYNHNKKTFIPRLIRQDTPNETKYAKYLCEYLLSLPKYSQDSIVYSYYGAAEEYLDHFDRSQQLYLTSLKINPQSAETHNRYAMYLETHGNDIGKAEKHHKAAIGLLGYYVSSVSRLTLS